MENFWQTLRRPIFALAPLSGYTDSAFRQICKSFGADVVYSELTSASALARASRPSLELLRFEEMERPYVVQLFGSEPECFAAAVRLVTERVKPDGIDINFGCPIAKVVKRGAGAALMANLPQARRVLQSVLENTGLPVSIKTRTSVHGVGLASFLECVADLDIKALMIHGRTLNQGFSGPNDIETTIGARNHFRGIVLANGGIRTAQEGMELLERTGADGIGVARGSLGKPWIFRELKDRLDGSGNPQTSGREIRATAMRHAELAIALKGGRGILEMRKHLCRYTHGLPNARHLRREAAGINSFQDIENVLATE